MPANLTPAYYDAEEKFKSAGTPRENLNCLRGMLSAIPKHKGTEKLQGDIKRRIAQLTHEEERDRKSGNRGPGVDHVPREGAGQVALVGETNVGKTSLFFMLTGVDGEIGDYPFTTLKPHPGMVHFEDVQIQLVDSPPYSDEYQEAWLPNVGRGAHALLLVIDLSRTEPPESQAERLIGRLESVGLVAVPEETAEDELVSEWTRRAIVLGNKRDLAGKPPAMVGGFQLHAVSAEEDLGLDATPALLFRLLRIIRVYTKIPGKHIDKSRPYVLPVGARLGDFCRQVHKDFAKNLRFARLWREGPFQGIQVHQDHTLQDQDVVELHL